MPHVANSVGFDWGLRIYFLNKFLGDAKAADVGLYQLQMLRPGHSLRTTYVEEPVYVVGIFWRQCFEKPKFYI